MGSMQANFGPKMIACLQIAAIKSQDDQRWALYDQACQQFGERAILAKFDALTDRGYIDCGVSARTGWLTDKGKQALAAIAA